MERYTLRQKLQGYCDCCLTTDPKEELVRLSQGGLGNDPVGDIREAVVKLMGLMILYGLRENAQALELWRDPQGRTRLEVQAAGKYQLPAPASELVDEAFSVMRAITHLEGETAKEPLSLGLGQESISLEVAFERSHPWEILKLSLPRT